MCQCIATLHDTNQHTIEPHLLTAATLTTLTTNGRPSVAVVRLRLLITTRLKEVSATSTQSVNTRNNNCIAEKFSSSTPWASYCWLCSVRSRKSRWCSNQCNVIVMWCNAEKPQVKRSIVCKCVVHLPQAFLRRPSSQDDILIKTHKGMHKFPFENGFKKPGRAWWRDAEEDKRQQGGGRSIQGALISQ